MAVCPSCGQENAERARFCNACAAPLVAEASAEVRKTVTVLFCDLVGSTALGDHSDPELLREAMSRFHAELRTILERHGGSVEKFVGDARFTGKTSITKVRGTNHCLCSEVPARWCLGASSLTRLGITGQLAKTLCSTNPCESMIEIVRYTQRNVKRWRDGDMRKRIIGYRDLAKLVIAAERHALSVHGRQEVGEPVTV